MGEDPRRGPPDQPTLCFEGVGPQRNPALRNPALATGVEQAAKAFKDVPGGADVEIIERHHRFKEDSPSGTAIKLGQIIAKEMEVAMSLTGTTDVADLTEDILVR